MQYLSLSIRKAICSERLFKYFTKTLLNRFLYSDQFIQSAFRFQQYFTPRCYLKTAENLGHFLKDVPNSTQKKNWGNANAHFKEDFLCVYMSNYAYLHLPTYTSQRGSKMCHSISCCENTFSDLNTTAGLLTFLINLLFF